MTNASDKPAVRQYNRKEVHTGDLEVGQRTSVNLDLPRESESIIGIDENLDQDDLAALAFMEEPITIVIQKSSEKFAPNVVDCWVNGRGAEIFDEGLGKWMVCGWLPVGKPVTTRRKYVEVLARAKPETIETEVRKYEDREDNIAHRNVSTKYPFSVLQDKNPKGYAWLTKVIGEI